MNAQPGLLGPSDAQLVERVLAADRDAFAQVYDRYGTKLFDFAYSMLRHREDAADAVADSFILFAEKLPQLRDPDRLRPWLYAIVRSECLRRLKARKRIAYGDDEQLMEMADDAMSPDQHAEQTALRQLVWDAAAGLADRDRALLDLHLRQGLEGAELGEAMGTTAANAYVMLNRLRAQVDRSLGALLIARLGRDDCEELDTLLVDWDGSFSPLIRKRVARHVDSCKICGDRRKKLVSPWALLASVPVFVAPLALRERVLNETPELVAYVGPPAAPSTGRGWTRTRPVVIVAALLLLLLIAAPVLLWANDDDGDPSPAPPAPTPTETADDEPTIGGTPTLSPTEAPSATPTPSPTVSASPTPLVSESPAAAELTVSPLSIDLGRRASRGTFQVGNLVGEPLTYSVASRAGWLTASPTAGSLDGGDTGIVTVRADRSRLPEGRSTGRIVVTGAGKSITVTVTLVVERPPVVGAPRITIANPSCDDVPVTATVSDESGLASVVLHWSGPSGTGQRAMTGSGTSWSTTMGPFPLGGNVTMYVVARDSRGNTTTGPSRTQNVFPCPG